MRHAPIAAARWPASLAAGVAKRQRRAREKKCWGISWRAQPIDFHEFWRPVRVSNTNTNKLPRQGPSSRFWAAHAPHCPWPCLSLDSLGSSAATKTTGIKLLWSRARARKLPSAPYWHAGIRLNETRPARAVRTVSSATDHGPRTKN